MIGGNIMYGLAAIEQANGWAMAGAGACIVLSGLAMLCFLISLIPRITGAFEKKVTLPAEQKVKEPESKETTAEERPNELDATFARYMGVTQDLGEDFTLIDLHKKSRSAGLPDPHLSVNRLRQAGMLVSVGDERFAWKTPSE